MLTFKFGISSSGGGSIFGFPLAKIDEGTLKNDALDKDFPASTMGNYIYNIASSRQSAFLDIFLARLTEQKTPFSGGCYQFLNGIRDSYKVQMLQVWIIYLHER